MDPNNNRNLNPKKTGKMWQKKLLPLFFLIFSLFSIYPALFAIDNIDREKLTLEETIEKRIIDSLSKILNPQDFIVIVKIEPVAQELEKARAPQKMEIEDMSAPKEKKATKDYILPGIPVKKNIGEEEKTTVAPVQVIIPAQENQIEIMKQFIKKLTVTVSFSMNVPDKVIEEARKNIDEIIDINTDRGDKLIIEKFSKNKTPWWQSIATFTSIMWIVVIALLAFFLFGPFNEFLKHLLRTLSIKSADSQSSDFAAKTETRSTAGGSFGSGALTMIPDSERKTKHKLFAFINEGNLKNLIYLFKSESPERIALVLGYLRNDWASYILSQLPADMQAKVALELVNVKQLQPDDVEVMELELKKKIDYLVGGAAQIIELLERSDKKTSENILSALSIADPGFAEHVKMRLVLIDDLSFIEAAGLRLLFREIQLPSWAIGLKAAKESTREKVLSTLPPGAAEMLKQEMDLNANVNQQRIDEEEIRIVMTMRKLRDESKITIVRTNRLQEPESVRVTEEKEQEKMPAYEPQSSRTGNRDERLARIKERLKKERGG